MRDLEIGDICIIEGADSLNGKGCEIIGKLSDDILEIKVIDTNTEMYFPAKSLKLKIKNSLKSFM